MRKQKGSKSGQYFPLTKTQKEVLRLYSVEYLTPVKIANLRSTSLKAVYKTINILRRKGELNTQTKKVQFLEHRVPNKNNHKIRLHNQHFCIKLIKKGNNYSNIMTNSNMFKIDDNTIKLHNDSIEVYSNKSFFSDTTHKATSKSFDYWNRFFIRLENELDIVIVKAHYKNIRLVQNHYAETNNELAEETNKENVKIRVYSTEDNKMWFEIDNSFNLNEAETTHPKTAKQDMSDIIQPFFNDLRNNFNDEVPTISKILESINELTKQNLETAKGLNAVVKLMKAKEPNNKDFPQEIKGLPDYIG